MFESASQLVEAVEGHFGEEAQAEAMRVAEELGLLQQWESEEDAAAEEEYLAALDEELGRLEQQLGHPLTKAEEAKIINGLSTEDLDSGTVPDLVEAHAQELGNRRFDDTGRVERSAERVQEVMDEQEAQSQAPPEPVSQPAPAAPGSDTHE